MNAAYALPMKLNKKWEWEHSWFAFSIFGVAVVPTIALAYCLKLRSTYATVSGGDIDCDGTVRRQLGRVSGFFWTCLD